MRTERTVERPPLLLALPIRRIRGEQLMAFYTGYVLETLSRQRNFTSDTIPSRAKTEWRYQEEVISMRIMMICMTDDCPLHMSPFSELTEIRTLTSSDLLPSGPYQLSSLAMPLNILVVCMLLTAALLKGFQISLKKSMLRINLCRRSFTQGRWTLDGRPTTLRSTMFRVQNLS